MYNTIDEIIKYVDTCKKQLVELGYKEVEEKQYYIKFNLKNTKTLGLCKKMSNTQYVLTFNKNYMQYGSQADNNNTIMHEIIHSLNDCMCHTGKWKQIANEVNLMYGYTISRTKIANDLMKTSPEYAKFIKKDVPPRYVIECTKCHLKTFRRRKSKMIDEIQSNNGNYYCTKCGNHHFIVTDNKA